MSLKSFLKSFLSKNKSLNTRERTQPHANKVPYESLERRELLAGMINVDAGAGVLRVVGDAGDNIGVVREQGASTLRVTLTDSGATQVFDVDSAGINQVVFLGYGGDDEFTNLTSIEGLLLGGAGNDTLIGGSGFDQIAGGSGNNELRGNDGNDRLIGGIGNDTIFGGNGDDFVLGGEGTNTIRGNAGDDLIFGGNGVDTILGGAGRDEIFGLAGNDILDAGAGGTANASELILGLDGDDTITGGSGHNNLWGGNGDDIITAGNGTSALANRLHGQDGNDILTGGTGNDLIRGLLGNDTINAGAGNDFLVPGFGDDTVNAGSGNDFVEFSRDFSDFIITGSGSNLDVQDRFDIDGNDDVNAAERFRFAGMNDQTAQSGATHSMNIRPIVVSNTNGSNTAENFGDASQEEAIQREARFILYQAGVDLNFLNEKTLNNTFANVGSSNVRPATDLDQVVSIGNDAGVGNPRSKTINVYFVEVAAGGEDNGEDFTRGLARLDPDGVNDNGVMLAVGDNLVDFNGGRVLVARTFAHEIGHNLGLFHTTASGNLMNLSGSGSASRLTNAQISTIQDSRFAIPTTQGNLAVDDGALAGADLGDDTGGCGCGVCAVCAGA